MTASVTLIRRRSAMFMPLAFAAVSATLLLAGCEKDAPPPEMKPLSFDYLPKLRLNVGSIDIDNAWAPATVPDGTHVEALAPQQPVELLKRMAQERLLPVGTTGHAVLVIDDASLIQRAGQYEGAFAVHLDISTTEGAHAGEAKASVNATRTIVQDSPNAARAALYELTKRMMADMNAELEFQIRKSLHDYLQTAVDSATPAQPVQAQDLQTTPAPAPAQ